MNVAKSLRHRHSSQRDRKWLRYGRGWAEALEPRVLLSAYYEAEVLARTGDLATGGGTIAAIEPQVSINSSGKVAFVASLDDQGVSTSNLMLADPVGQSLQRIGLAGTPARAYYLLQINDGGIVIARDRPGPTRGALVSLSGEGGDRYCLCQAVGPAGGSIRSGCGA